MSVLQRLGAALALLVCQSALAAAQDGLSPHPNIEISYVEPGSAQLKATHDRLKERKYLERISTFLSPLRLPSTLKITATECGALTKVYTRKDGVTICYEFIQEIKSAAKAASTSEDGIVAFYKKVVPDEPVPKPEAVRGMLVYGAVLQSSLYRVSLGLLDLYDIPIWGRYTDAADRLAAFVLLQVDPDIAAYGFYGAEAFFLASKKTWTGTDFAAVRSPTLQRRFNYLCMAYGAEPGLFSLFGETLGERAGRCADEYKQASRAFYTLISPHIDEQKALEVKAVRVLEDGDF